MISATHHRMAERDPGDYAAIQRDAVEVRGFEAEVTQLEERWLELADLLG